jgi:hypothetical protein
VLVKSGAAVQVVSVGPYRVKVTVPVGWNVPVTLAVSWSVMPGAPPAEAAVVTDVGSLPTVTCSSVQAVETLLLLASPLYLAIQL